MYDPYSRVFRPDMQANDQLPQWQPMGESGQGQQTGQATGSFVDLLKKRMSTGGAAKGAGGAMGAGGMAGGAGGAEGGGMQSL